MPIYAYKCSSCGHAQDVLQKMSDAPLTGCPQCHAETFAKQLTAPGFQLRGSGWYATDFKNGSGQPSAKPNGATEPTKTEPAKAEPAKTESTTSAAAGGCGHGGCSACS
jgi:putative FmdB family regulatory protein